MVSEPRFPVDMAPDGTPMHLSWGFAQVQAHDLKLIRHWLVTAHVAKWWGTDAMTDELWDGEWMARLRGERKMDTRMIQITLAPDLGPQAKAGRGRSFTVFPIGLMQIWDFKDFPDLKEAVEPDNGAFGLDMLIGEEQWVHRGFGQRAVTGFVWGSVFRQITKCPAIFLRPLVSNSGAIRCFEKAGFRHWKTVRLPGCSEDSYVMHADRYMLRSMARLMGMV